MLLLEHPTSNIDPCTYPHKGTHYLPKFRLSRLLSALYSHFTFV
jgi:hypothetical protein